MERDLEASRLYADASEEKAQADRIIAMGLQLEGAVKLMGEKTLTVDEMEAHLVTIDQRASQQRAQVLHSPLGVA